MYSVQFNHQWKHKYGNWPFLKDSITPGYFLHELKSHKPSNTIFSLGTIIRSDICPSRMFLFLIFLLLDVSKVIEAKTERKY